jgi:hypothetical protein
MSIDAAQLQADAGRILANLDGIWTDAAAAMHLTDCLCRLRPGLDRAAALAAVEAAMELATICQLEGAP